MKWVLPIVAAIVLAVAGWWLWKYVFISDETRVTRLISAMEQAVEKPNLVQLSDAIAADYSDGWGLDKQTVLGAVRSFRDQYDAVFIHNADLKVTVEQDHRKAQALLVVKVLAKPKGSVTETEVRADRYRLFFRKTDDGWKLYSVETPELKFE